MEAQRFECFLLRLDRTAAFLASCNFWQTYELAGATHATASFLCIKHTSLC